MPKSAREYGITEIFYSIQGEGFYSGMPAIFIRLAGCNDNCDFCDTDYSLKVRMTAKEILDKCAEWVNCSNIIFTGGEPLLQVDLELVKAFHLLNYSMYVETNGSVDISKELKGYLWVTCSPKFLPIQIVKERIDELKLLYNEQGRYMPTDFDNWEGCKKYLQPVFGVTEKGTVKYVKDHPEWFLSVQAHKFIGVE